MLLLFAISFTFCCCWRLWAVVVVVFFVLDVVAVAVVAFCYLLFAISFLVCQVGVVAILVL